MRRLRAKGCNLRYYAIIGVNQKAQQLVRDIEQMGWLGLKCVYFVDDNPALIGTKLLGIPVYGPLDKLTELVEKMSEVILEIKKAEIEELDRLKK